ncbi:MAG TPA: hypothetical protein VHW01_27475 [Polyangiaceae bacterium]|jgi:hypothetical protein|nr:hypothetical protein [Polyangiaceae bacterium]
MKARLALLSLALGLGFSGTLHADANALQARLSCQKAAGPGRVLCELTTKSSSDKLVWSDALVVRAPGFARPLRSRFVAQVGAGSEPGAAWAKLALVASGPGQGQLELLARGVVCPEPGAGEPCKAVALPVSALIEVGQVPP